MDELGQLWNWYENVVLALIVMAVPMIVSTTLFVIFFGDFIDEIKRNSVRISAVLCLVGLVGAAGMVWSINLGYRTFMALSGET